jgi:hypothetical protein
MADAHHADCSHLLTLVPHSRVFHPEDGGDMFLRNVGSHKIYTAPHPRRRHSLWLPLWKPQIIQYTKLFRNLFELEYEIQDDHKIKIIIDTELHLLSLLLSPQCFG